MGRPEEEYEAPATAQIEAWYEANQSRLGQPSETDLMIDYLSIRSMFANLPPRYVQTLKWRFGLEGEEQLTLREVGAKLGISHEAVREIQVKALAKLRRMLEAEDQNHGPKPSRPKPQGAASAPSLDKQIQLYGSAKYAALVKKLADARAARKPIDRLGVMLGLPVSKQLELNRRTPTRLMFLAYLERTLAKPFSASILAKTDLAEYIALVRNLWDIH